eukprot:5971118-Pleurochrysis_carterae.AAC.1
MGGEEATGVGLRNQMGWLALDPEPDVSRLKLGLRARVPASRVRTPCLCVDLGVTAVNEGSDGGGMFLFSLSLSYTPIFARRSLSQYVSCDGRKELTKSRKENMLLGFVSHAGCVLMFQRASH